MVPEMFKCPFCGKSFDDPYAYAEHIAICAKEKKERDRKRLQLRIKTGGFLNGD